MLDESKLAKSVIRVLDARFACQYNQFFTTECKKGKLMDDALGKDYCAGKNTLLVLDRKKAKTSKCPDVSGTTSRFRQNAGLDICYYFAKPTLKGASTSGTGVSQSSSSVGSSTTSPGTDPAQESYD